MAKSIVVTLTAFSCGSDPVTTYSVPADRSSDSDIGAWMAYVRENIAESTGLDNVKVDRLAILRGCAKNETEFNIEGATREQREGIREALEELWQIWREEAPQGIPI